MAAPPTTLDTAAPVLATQIHLVDVGGRRIAFHVVPGLPPAVVFEAGNGMDGSSWDPVLGTVYGDTGAELITFDSAGYDSSDEDTRPTRIEHDVDDLKAGLSDLGVEHGIVLVGHSFSGEVAFPSVPQHPGIVTHVVLVDAPVPSFCADEETVRMAASFPKNIERSDKQGRTMNRYLAAFPTMQQEFCAVRWPGDVPATMIMSEHPPFATAADAAWNQDHVNFAHAAANRTLVVATNSGHVVMTDRPDLLAQTVIAAVEHVRQTAPR